MCHHYERTTAYWEHVEERASDEEDTEPGEELDTPEIEVPEMEQLEIETPEMADD
jgi:hypothetical protein